MHADRHPVRDDLTPDSSVTIRDRLSRRAWSRAGAVGAVLSEGPSRRALAITTRVGLLVAGSFLIAASVAVTLWTELGPGPLDVFIGAVRNITGLPMSVAVWATVGASIAIAWLLGRRPGFGTILSPILIGPMLQFVYGSLSAYDAPGSVLVLILLQVVAVAGIGLGAGALIVSGLGAGSGELFAGAASDRVRRPEPMVRAAIELSWVVAGVALGGPIGLGTVMVALLIGPAVGHGHRIIDGLAVRSRRGIVHTHGAIVERDLAHSV
ncbi:YczE/YyaS/YitT family protein [Ilumatobacter sp.]|uniref:YczE/YyaS/YitT family protein n=1 Tax=Ilumatobacter sp. TaxID=1967498 RepID=UPI003C571C88